MFYKLKFMIDHNLQNIVLALLGITGIEIVSDVNVQEWAKILLQAAVAAATLYKVFKNDKEKNNEG